jgi:cell wall-associated NlpC family hydrolase
MKRLATISTLTLILVSCSADGYSHNNYSMKQTPSQAMPGSSFIQAVIFNNKKTTYLENLASEALAKKVKIAEQNKAKVLNKIAIDSRMLKLQEFVGKTRYVFSGSSTTGWDCSGLVRWYYLGLGIDLPHSASKQGILRPKVDAPKPGDIVVFRYKNARSYHHSAIYLGNNKIIHAGFRSGGRTEILSLDSPAFKNNIIKFVRILEN